MACSRVGEQSRVLVARRPANCLVQRQIHERHRVLILGSVFPVAASSTILLISDALHSLLHLKNRFVPIASSAEAFGVRSVLDKHATLGIDRMRTAFMYYEQSTFHVSSYHFAVEGPLLAHAKFCHLCIAAVCGPCLCHFYKPVNTFHLDRMAVSADRPGNGLSVAAN